MTPFNANISMGALAEEVTSGEFEPRKIHVGLTVDKVTLVKLLT
jgi:hypothetical protein